MQVPFKLKQWVSLTLGISFVIMSVTGMVLYIVPQEKVAYWAGWTLLGLSKEQWGALHITSMFLMVVIAVWHIYYNWKPLVSYLKNSAHTMTLAKKEFLAAVALNGLFVVGTLFALQPIQGLLDANDGIKAYWEGRYGSPPYGHAEESTLKVFARHIGQDGASAMAVLRGKGIHVDHEAQTLEQIAGVNGITPQKIYDALKVKDYAKGSRELGITSLGRKTLLELSRMGKIDLKQSLAYLKKSGLEVSEDSPMKGIAEHFEKTPLEMYRILVKASNNQH